MRYCVGFPPPLGTLVYPFGRPLSIGIVRRIVRDDAIVELPNGATIRAVYWTFSSIDDLIDDHAHKLGTHLRRRAAAAAAFNLPQRNLPVIIDSSGKP